MNHIGMRAGLSTLLPLIGIVLLGLGVAFEIAGQPITRYGPLLAGAAAAVVGVRLLSRFRR